MSAIGKTPDSSASSAASSAAAAASAQKPKVTASFQEGVFTLRTEGAPGKPSTVRQIPVSVGGKTADPAFLKRYERILISVFENVEKPETIQGVALLKSGKIRIRRVSSESTFGAVPKLVSSILTPTSAAPADAVPQSKEYTSLVGQVHDQAKFAKELDSACKNYSAATVRKALDTILNEPHAHLVADQEWTPTLADCLQKVGNEGLRAALQTRAETLPLAGEKVTDLDSCQQDIIKFILSRMVKETKVIQDGKTLCTQTFVRGTGSTIAAKAFETQHSLPASTQNDTAQLRHCTNLGIVQVTNKATRESDITLRSGATDNVDRLVELVRLSLMTELQACHHNVNNGKFRPVDNSNRVFEFNHVISNYVDLGEQDALMEAVNKWPSDGVQMKLTVSGKPKPDGTPTTYDITIIIKRPIVENQSLSQLVLPDAAGQTVSSTASTDATSQKRSDESNFVGNQRLLACYLQDKKPADLEGLKGVSEALAEKLEKTLGEGKKAKEYINVTTGLIDFDKIPNTKLVKAGDALFGSKAFKDYQEATAKFLLQELENPKNEKSTLTSLYAVLFCRMPPANFELSTKFALQPKPEERCSAFQLEVFRHNLCVDLKLSKSVQCENGSDKTGKGVAIREAAAHFRAANEGRAFMPPPTPDAVKKYINEAMRAHGSGVEVETTGATGIKANTAQRNIKPEDVRVVNEVACAILKRILEPMHLENKAGDKLINAKGELRAPVYKLGLNTTDATSGLKKQIDKIEEGSFVLRGEDGISRPLALDEKQKKLLLYTLTSMYHLARERNASALVAEPAAEEEMVSFTFELGDVSSALPTSTGSIAQGLTPRPRSAEGDDEASKALYEPIGREVKATVAKDIEDEKKGVASSKDAERAKKSETRGEQMKLAQAATRAAIEDVSRAAENTVAKAKERAEVAAKYTQDVVDATAMAVTLSKGEGTRRFGGLGPLKKDVADAVKNAKEAEAYAKGVNQDAKAAVVAAEKAAKAVFASTSPEEVKAAMLTLENAFDAASEAANSAKVAYEVITKIKINGKLPADEVAAAAATAKQAAQQAIFNQEFPKILKEVCSAYFPKIGLEVTDQDTLATLNNKVKKLSAQQKLEIIRETGLNVEARLLKLNSSQLTEEGRALKAGLQAYLQDLAGLVEKLVQDNSSQIYYECLLGTASGKQHMDGVKPSDLTFQQHIDKVDPKDRIAAQNARLGRLEKELASLQSEKQAKPTELLEKQILFLQNHIVKTRAWLEGFKAKNPAAAAAAAPAAAAPAAAPKALKEAAAPVAPAVTRTFEEEHAGKAAFIFNGMIAQLNERMGVGDFEELVKRWPLPDLPLVHGYLTNKINHMPEGPAKDALNNCIAAIERVTTKPAVGAAVAPPAAAAQVEKAPIPSSDIFKAMVKGGLTDDPAKVLEFVQKHKERLESAAPQPGSIGDIYLQIMNRFNKRILPEDNLDKKSAFLILAEVCAESQPALTKIEEEEKAEEEFSQAVNDNSIEDLAQLQLNGKRNKLGDTPLHALCLKKELDQVMALQLLASATREQLTRTNSNGKTALEIAYENNYSEVANAIIAVLLKDMKDGDFNVLWAAISKNKPSDKNVEALLKGFKEAIAAAPDPSQAYIKTLQAVIENYEGLKDAPLSEGEKLQCACLLARHLPKESAHFELHFDTFKQDLARCALSDTATGVILDRLDDKRITNLTPEMYGAIVSKYKDIREHVQEIHLRGSEALTTAIIVACDIPRIQAVADNAIQGYLPHEEGRLPKGWQLLKDAGKIYVISGHALGEGTSKKATTAVQVVLGSAEPPHPVVHLQTGRVAGPEQRAALQQEMEIHLALGGKDGSDNFVRVHQARVENQGDLSQMGMIVELCDVPLDRALQGQQDTSPERVLDRLQVFLDIAEAVETAHSKGIAHGDIDVKNCFVKKVTDGPNKGQLRGKLGDLGTAVYADKPLPARSSFTPGVILGEDGRSIYGSPENSSPEIWFRHLEANPSVIDVKAADVWALGMMLKAVYDEKFTWSKDLDKIKERDVFNGRMQTEIVDELAILEKKQKTGPLSAEEQTKYQVYKLIAELLKPKADERCNASKVVRVTKAAMQAIRDLVTARAAAVAASVAAPAAAVQSQPAAQEAAADGLAAAAAPEEAAQKAAAAPTVAEAVSPAPTPPHPQEEAAVEEVLREGAEVLTPAPVTPAAPASVLDVAAAVVPPPPPQPEPVKEAEKEAISLKAKEEEKQQAAVIAEERAARSKVLNVQKDAQKAAIKQEIKEIKEIKTAIKQEIEEIKTAAEQEKAAAEQGIKTAAQAAAKESKYKADLAELYELCFSSNTGNLNAQIAKMTTEVRSTLRGELLSKTLSGELLSKTLNDATMAILQALTEVEIRERLKVEPDAQLKKTTLAYVDYSVSEHKSTMEKLQPLPFIDANITDEELPTVSEEITAELKSELKKQLEIQFGRPLGRKEDLGQKMRELSPEKQLEVTNGLLEHVEAELKTKTEEQQEEIKALQERQEKLQARKAALEATLLEEKPVIVQAEAPAAAAALVPEEAAEKAAALQPQPLAQPISDKVPTRAELEAKAAIKSPPAPPKAASAGVLAASAAAVSSPQPEQAESLPAAAPQAAAAPLPPQAAAALAAKPRVWEKKVGTPVAVETEADRAALGIARVHTKAIEEKLSNMKGGDDYFAAKQEFAALQALARANQNKENQKLQDLVRITQGQFDHFEQEEGGDKLLQLDAPDAEMVQAISKGGLASKPSILGAAYKDRPDTPSRLRSIFGKEIIRALYSQKAEVRESAITNIVMLAEQLQNSPIRQQIVSDNVLVQAFTSKFKVLENIFTARPEVELAEPKSVLLEIPEGVLKDSLIQLDVAVKDLESLIQARKEAGVDKDLSGAMQKVEHSEADSFSKAVDELNQMKPSTDAEKKAVDILKGRLKALAGTQEFMRVSHKKEALKEKFLSGNYKITLENAYQVSRILNKAVMASLYSIDADGLPDDRKRLQAYQDVFSMVKKVQQSGLSDADKNAITEQVFKKIKNRLTDLQEQGKSEILEEKIAAYKEIFKMLHVLHSVEGRDVLQSLGKDTQKSIIAFLGTVKTRVNTLIKLVQVQQPLEEKAVLYKEIRLLFDLLSLKESINILRLVPEDEGVEEKEKIINLAKKLDEVISSEDSQVTVSVETEILAITYKRVHAAQQLIKELREASITNTKLEVLEGLYNRAKAEYRHVERAYHDLAHNTSFSEFISEKFKGEWNSLADESAFNLSGIKDKYVMALQEKVRITEKEAEKLSGEKKEAKEQESSDLTKKINALPPVKSMAKFSPPVKENVNISGKALGKRLEAFSDAIKKELVSVFLALQVDEVSAANKALAKANEIFKKQSDHLPLDLPNLEEKKEGLKEAIQDAREAIDIYEDRLAEGRGRRGAVAESDAAARELRAFDRAMRALNVPILVELQQKGAVNFSGNTPLEALSTANTLSPRQLKVALALLEKLDNNNIGKEAFESACSKGHIELIGAFISSKKIDPFIPNRDGNTPFHLLCGAKSKEEGVPFAESPNELAIITSFINAATIDQLTHKNKKGKTALELACSNGHWKIVDAIISRLLKEDKSLDTTLLEFVSKNQLPESVVQGILAGIQEQIKSQDPSQPPFKMLKAVMDRYDALESQGIPTSHERLQCAFFLEQHLPKGDEAVDLQLTKFKHDLLQNKFSDRAVEIIIENLGTKQIKNIDKQVCEKIAEQFTQIRSKVKAGHLHGAEVLTTAIIIAHDIPKVNKTAAAVFQGEGYVSLGKSAPADITLPAGWQLLKDQGKIYVISGHALGEGTFKKAATAVQFVFESLAEPAAVVHLQTTPEALSDAQKAQFKREIEVGLQLRDIPNVVYTHTARIENPDGLDQVGMIVELCDSDLEHFLGKVNEETDTLDNLIERLEIFEGLVTAVDHMHSRGLVHGDIKDANCFIKTDAEGKKIGKLSDFGTVVAVRGEIDPSTGQPSPASIAEESSFRQGAYGTAVYSAHELRYRPSNTKLDVGKLDLPPADIWALGLVLKKVVNGQDFSWLTSGLSISEGEFNERMGKELLQPLLELEAKIKAGECSPKERAKYHVFNLIKDLVNPNPASGKRFTSKEAVEATRKLIGDLKKSKT